MLNLHIPSSDKQVPKVSEAFILENVLKTKQKTSIDILFDSIIMPHWGNYVTMHDLEVLHWCATAKVLSSNVDRRRMIIRQVLEPRGFKRLTGGTNREVYVHYEDQSIVAKIALDRVGLNDNQREYDVQKLLFPWVAKMIQVCPSGVLGFAERVNPILSRKEYNAYLPMIYMMLTEILGKYVMEDVGTDFFKNVGIRENYGVVLLDYPYVYELDGNKLHCNNVIDDHICGGEIDYDVGMNHLYCTRCKKQYLASDLQRCIDTNKISIDNSKGGRKPMMVKLVKGDKVLASSYDSDSIVRPNVSKPIATKSRNGFHANIVKNGKIIGGTDVKKPVNNEIQEVVSIPDTVVDTSVDETVMTSRYDVKKEEEERITIDEQIAEKIKNPVKEEVVVKTVTESVVRQEAVVKREEEKPQQEQQRNVTVEEDASPEPWGHKKKEPEKDDGSVKPFVLNMNRNNSQNQSNDFVFTSRPRVADPYKNNGGRK